MKNGTNVVLREGLGLAETSGALLLDAMTSAVRAAGAAIMAVYAGEVSVRLKDDRTPLTEADLASHSVLVAALAAVAPGLPVVSEEGGLPDHHVRAAWPAYWLIDPLDGTKEFLARNGEFTVNLALIEHGQPTLGVVGVPARGQMFTGDVAAQSARRIDADGTTAIRARAYSGSSPTVVASRRHGGDALQGALDRLQRQHGPVTTCNVGSALKFCLLAEGGADVYPRLAPTSEWDTAAAQAVLEAAGGAVLQLNGAPLYYTKPDILNPEFVAVADPSVAWVPWFADNRC